MKCSWKSSVVASLLVGLVLMLPAGPQAQTPTVDLSIGDVTVTQAGTGASQTRVAVPVSIGTLGGAEIYAIKFGVSFDPSVLTPVKAEAAPGGPAANWFVQSRLDEVDGKVIVSLAGGSPLAAAGDLVYLHFTASGQGADELSFIAADVLFNEGDVAYGSLSSGTVTINPPSSAAPILSLPTAPVSVLTGETVSVPVSIGELGDALIYSVHFEVDYDSALLPGVSVTAAPDGPAAGWFAQFRVESDELFGDRVVVSLSGGSPLGGEGKLVYLHFQTLSGVTAAQSAFFSLGTEVLFNEGDIAAGTGTALGGTIVIVPKPTSVPGLRLPAGPVVGRSGGMISVPVSIDLLPGDPDILSIQFEVGYDADLLALESVTAAPAGPAASWFVQSSADELDETTSVSTVSLSGGSPLAQGGELVYLNFQAASFEFTAGGPLTRTASLFGVGDVLFNEEELTGSFAEGAGATTVVLFAGSLPAPVLSLGPAGPDAVAPVVDVATGVRGVAAGATGIVVPVSIVPVTDGPAIHSIQFVASYDPAVLTATGVAHTSGTGQKAVSDPSSVVDGWLVQSNINATEGKVVVSLAGPDPNAALPLSEIALQGKLVDLVFSAVNFTVSQKPLAVAQLAFAGEPLFNEDAGQTALHTGTSFTVYAAPLASFTFSSSKRGDNSLDVQFNSTSQTPAIIKSYEWDTDGNPGNGYEMVGATPYRFVSAGSSISVSLKVTNWVGVSHTSLTSSINAPNPAPAQPQFTASPTRGVQSQSVSFSLSTTQNATSWSWDFGDGQSGSGQSPSHTYGPGSYTVTVTASGPGGSTPYTRTNYITIYPQVTADFAPSSTEVLTNQPITFVNQSQNAVSFAWSGDLTSSLASPTASFATGGTKSITLTAFGQGHGVDGLTNQAMVTKAVTVYERVVADFEISPPEPLTGDPVTFTDRSTGNPTSWTWDIDGTIRAGQSTTDVFNTAGLKTITLTVRGQGPVDLNNTARATKTLTVHNRIVKPVVRASRTTALVGQTITFSTDFQAGAQFAWDLDGDGQFNDGSGVVQSRSYQASGTYNVSVRATGGGPSSNTQTSDPVTVQVFAPLETPLPISVSPGTVSPSDPNVYEVSGNLAVTLNFTGSGAANVLSWQWSGAASGTAPSVTLPTATSVYTVTLTVQGRGDDSQSRTLRISVGGAILANFTASPTEVKVGDPVTFTNTSLVSGTVSYSWDFGAGASPATSTQATPGPVSYTSAGDKTVRLTITRGAESSQVAKTIVVGEVVSAEFRLVDPPEVIYTGTPLRFEWTSPVTRYRSLLWNFGEGASPPTSSLRNPGVTYSTAGLKTVTLTVTGYGTDNSPSSSQNFTVTARVQVRIDGPADVVRGKPVSFTGVREAGQVTSWNWRFPDGIPPFATGLTGADQSEVSTTFNAAGGKTVSVTVVGSTSEDVWTARKSVTVWEPVKAAFLVLPEKVEVGKEVTFTGRSTGDIAGRVWDFGDGTPTVADQLSVRKIFTQAGTFPVSLTVTGRGPDDVSVETRQVRVIAPPQITPPISALPALEDNNLVVNLTGQGTAPLTWTLQVLEGGRRLTAVPTVQGNQVTFVPKPDSSGSVRVKFTLTDADLGTATQEVVLVWTPVPDPPTIALLNPGAGATQVSSPLALTWRGRDPDPGDVLRYDVYLGTNTGALAPVAVGQTFDSYLTDVLPQGQTYSWKVVVTDGVTTVDSGERSFTTAPDTRKPVVVRGPSVAGITETGATIQWTTDEKSNSVVTLTIPSGTQGGSDGSLVLEHAVALSGLAPGVEYTYQVTSVDAAGNASDSKSGTFTTLTAPDVTPPQILTGPIAVGVTGPTTQGAGNARATIQWSTDEASTSEVRVSLTEAGLGSAAPVIDGSLVRNHAVALTGLLGGQEYFYEVVSKDAATPANVSPGKRGRFRTPAGPDVTPPQILTGPSAVGITAATQNPETQQLNPDAQATIRWTTDEASSSVVEYGETEALGQFQRLTALEREHGVVLGGLKGGQGYQYRVYSVDASNNKSVARTGSFQTLATADLIPPRILTGPAVSGLTAVADPADPTRAVASATLRWTTNEASDSRVSYSYAGTDLSVALGEAVLSHAVALTNLPAETQVSYTVGSTDASGNSSAAKGGQFTTPKRPDTTPPQILNGPIALGVTDVSAKIEWTTDEDADALVEAAAEGGEVLVAQNAARARKQSLALTNLAPDQTYTYTVTATDQNDLATVRSGLTFKTRKAPDVAPPQILTGPVVVTVLQDQAVIEWTTDELSDSEVIFQRTDGSTPETVTGSPEDVLRHSVRLTNLVTQEELDSPGWAGAEFRYTVRSTDASDNGPTEKGGAFTTKVAEDKTPPQILTGPVVRGLTAVTDAATGGTVASATIRWTTDEPSDSYLEYSYTDPDPAIGAVTQVIQLSDPVRDHAIALTNLPGSPSDPTQPAVTVSYQVQSTDVALLPNTSAPKGGSFDTPRAADIFPPQILTGPVALAIADSSARIEWTTDEDADARVDYGIALLGVLDQVVQRGERSRKQSIALTNLEPATEYLYQVTATDVAGLPTVKANRRFTTKATKDLAPPVITAGPAVVTVLQDQAVIEWTTDELSDSQVIFQEGTPTGQGSKAGFDFGSETVVTDPEDVLKHSVRLTNLTAQPLTGTTYQYWVRSTDVSDNPPVESAKKTFTTLAAEDTDPPRITRAPVALKLTDESATIVWSTDEPADGFVEYASEADYLLTGQYNRLAGSEQHSLKHEVDLTNLKDPDANPTGGYRYRVRSTDPAGNPPTYSGDASFTLLAVPDESPPVIVSRPVVTARTVDETVVPPTATATLQWVTDELADSRVRYGLDAAYGQEVVSSEDVLTHTVTLSNLEPNTEYHYQVESTDASDNPPVTGIDRTFTTLEGKDIDKPVIGGVTARNVTKTSATIEWITDEPATSVVDVEKAGTGQGRPNNYGGGHVERGELVKQHAVELTNLDPGSKYFFKVTSVDATGNLSSTDLRTGNFKSNNQFDTVKENKKIDQTPPQFLEGPVIFPSAEQAVIRWRTDEAADYKVEIGSDAGLTQDRQTFSSNALQESHDVTLTNLQRGTFYYYRVTVSDGPAIPGTKEQNYRTVGTAGGGAKRAKIAQPPGGAGSFVTLPEPDTQWPVLLSQPTVVAKTTSSLTVEWTTDEISDSFVDFGAGGDLGQNQGSPDNVNRHRVTLTNLAPGEKYTYQVGSTDPSGNGATRSSKLVASTDLERDLAPPRITDGPKLIWLTDQSATLEWTTDELSTSVVDYGLGVLDERRADPELVNRHRVTLTNLDPATEYTYQVGSVDGSLNGPTTSAQLTFTTDAEPDLASPEIVGGPDLVARSDQSAVIAWQTDEMANSAISYGLVETALDQQIGSGENVLEHQLTLTNLTPATTYYFQVSSVDRSNNGPTESAVLEFITNADADLIPPVAPVDLASQPGSQAAWVTWTANSEADLAGYNVYRQAAGEENYQLVATSLSAPRYLDQGLSNGVTYSYQVTALDNTLPPNESVPADPVESTPAAGNVPGAPAAKAAVGGLETSVLTIENATPVAGRETLTYTFQVSSDSTFSDVVAGEGLIAEGAGSETKWTFVQPLEEDVVYWWRAQANDGLFDGLWSPLSPSSSFSVTPVELPGDFDRDGDVDFDDFFAYADRFGLTPESPLWDPIFDLDGDLLVDFDDFFIFADNFGRSLTSKTTVVAAREGDLLPELKVMSIDRRYATLTLEVASPLSLQGYGLVLRLPSGVQIQSSVQDARVRADGQVQQLEGVLRSIPEQVWYGSYRLQGKPAEGAERVFEGTFELPPEAIGGEITVEELWAVDDEGQSMRMVGGPSVKLLPQVFALAHPYPNPFNPSVSLDYSLPEGSAVELMIFNVLGQKIRTLVHEVQNPGFYKAVWNGADDRGVEAASGIYFVRFEAGSFVSNRKVLMLK